MPYRYIDLYIYIGYMLYIQSNKKSNNKTNREEITVNERDCSLLGQGQLSLELHKPRALLSTTFGSKLHNVANQTDLVYNFDCDFYYIDIRLQIANN